MQWDSEEVGYSYTSDSVSLATRIKDSVEQSTCADGQLGQGDIVTCAQYKRVSKRNYYPISVEKFILLINANAEAPEFCNERLPTEGCPYEYSIRSLPGRLLSLNGSVVARFDGKEDGLRDLTVQSFLDFHSV